MFYNQRPLAGFDFSKLKSPFEGLKTRKYPSRKQWRQFFKVFSKKEKIIFLAFLLMFIASSLSLAINFYLKNTQAEQASGGKYIEGVLGQPGWINPIYAAASGVDRDLTELIFSGLMKYDSQGKIIPDLAENYEIKEDGKIYEVSLKQNLSWQDSQPLGADDVIFTIKTIQNSDYKSPVIASWLGVEVEKISDSIVRFKLRKPYSSFLENLTQKIIPEHIWKGIPPQSFPLAIYNLKPLGSGPYRIKELNRNKQGRIVSLDLVRNPKYHGKTPSISEISFRFFDKEEDLVKSYKKGLIKGFSLVNVGYLKDSKLARSAQQYSLSLPRYFALFFNPEKSKTLSDPNIRQALNYGTDKQEIIEKALFSYGESVESPILPDIYGFSPPLKIYQFDQDKAKSLFEKVGFKDEQGKLVKNTIKLPAFQFKTDLKEGSEGKNVENLQKCLANPSAGGPDIYPDGEITGVFGGLTKAAVIKFQEKYAKDILEPSGLEKGTGVASKATREKLNELCFPSGKETLPLKFSIATVDQPVLLAVANLLREQWAKMGVEIEIKTFDISKLEKEVIKQREYEGLLFGEVLTLVPDPFPFWHSSQTKDPGLNLALYQNKKADQLLEEIRQTIDETKRREKLEAFQDILIEDAPAVFIYSQDYLYLVSKEIKGISALIITDPSKRFSNIETWYIKTKRVWR